MPIINAPIPITGFYVVGATLLAAIYCYFHFYLQPLWRALATLPAVFRDGVTQDDKTDPWQLTNLVRTEFAQLRATAPPLTRLENRLSIVMAWWLVPVTLFALWARYLPAHDLGGLTWLAFLIGATTFFGRYTFRLARATLRGEVPPAGRTPPGGRSRTLLSRVLRELPRLRGGRSSSGSSCRSSSWSACRSARRPNRHAMPTAASPSSRSARLSTVFGRSSDAREALELRPDPDLCRLARGRAGADAPGLGRSELGRDQAGRAARRNLAFADATSAFLANADLRGATLTGAQLGFAQLQGADLRAAQLQDGVLWHAQLQGALLAEAQLQRANLTSANLQGANLSSAELWSAPSAGPISRAPTSGGPAPGR